MTDILNEISPIEFHDGIYLKRNDLVKVYSVNGGKAIGAYNLIKHAVEKGYKHIVTAGSRHSPQCKIVSEICEQNDLYAHLFLPDSKEETETMKFISQNKNSTIHHVKCGYNNVIISKSEQYAKENDYYYIPFGMKCLENILLISKQVQNIPDRVKRIIVPVGSGVTFLGILYGLEKYNRYDIELVGVQCGANSAKYVNKNIPPFCSVKYKIETFEPNLSESERYKKTVDFYIDGIKINERYESKCKDFIKENDLFWIVGV